MQPKHTTHQPNNISKTEWNSLHHTAKRVGRVSYKALQKKILSFSLLCWIFCFLSRKYRAIILKASRARNTLFFFKGNFVPEKEDTRRSSSMWSVFAYFKPDNKKQISKSSQKTKNNRTFVTYVSHQKQSEFQWKHLWILAITKK